MKENAHRERGREGERFNERKEKGRSIEKRRGVKSVPNRTEHAISIVFVLVYSSGDNERKIQNIFRLLSFTS